MPVIFLRSHKPTFYLSRVFTIYLFIYLFIYLLMCVQALQVTLKALYGIVASAGIGNNRKLTLVSNSRALGDDFIFPTTLVFSFFEIEFRDFIHVCYLAFAVAI